MHKNAVSDQVHLNNGVLPLQLFSSGDAPGTKERLLNNRYFDRCECDVAQRGSTAMRQLKWARVTILLCPLKCTRCPTGTLSKAANHSTNYN